jgi:hypothetical protein
MNIPKTTANASAHGLVSEFNAFSSLAKIVSIYLTPFKAKKQ